ncbi:hypothetical protein DPMN_053254 [Dreissena polymorpha]|uniref:Uncharacterized protein n=1 Tax=Dreissena polymorpha TaxID=45954 RepID=A0A9D4CLS3_DREPO|nr:hypothetical protein DPMN_053254 [Dreissena polymorpha]
MHSGTHQGFQQLCVHAQVAWLPGNQHELPSPEEQLHLSSVFYEASEVFLACNPEDSVPSLHDNVASTGFLLWIAVTFKSFLDTHFPHDLMIL